MQQQPKNFDFEETEENSLGDLFYKFLPYWPFLILLLLISMTVAWIYLRYKLPVYETTAALLIKDDKNSTPNSDLMDAFDMFDSKKNVENEVEVLQSKTLMQEVVKNLRLYAPVTIKGRVLTQSAYIYSPILIEAKNIDSITEVNKVYFKFNDATQSVSISNETYILNQWVSTPFGILKFIPNKYYQRLS